MQLPKQMPKQATRQHIHTLQLNKYNSTIKLPFPAYEQLSLDSSAVASYEYTYVGIYVTMHAHTYILYLNA